MDRIMVAAAIGMAIVFSGFMVGVLAMAWNRKADRRSRTQQPHDDAIADVTWRDVEEMRV